MEDENLVVIICARNFSMREMEFNRIKLIHFMILLKFLNGQVRLFVIKSIERLG